MPAAHHPATKNLTVPIEFIATSIIAHLKVNCRPSPHSISSVFGDKYRSFAAVCLWRHCLPRAATGAATLTPMASCSRTVVVEDVASDGGFGETDGFENRDRDLEGGNSDYNPEEDELREDRIDETDELYDEDDGLPHQPGGIHGDYAEDVFYAIDNADAIGVIEFSNLTMEEVCRYHFADIDLAFEFYQSYAKYHGFADRRHRTVRIDNVIVK
ncbi:hypothetical protein PIB30_074262 [Stylosanthes scabra]|uniref:Uncharacterized protein n=1 Tax=Stylosanthes scabra TaxID=79078 RepID=A0ABU6TQ37_9FABA|nr:hypothetical protein [Stylosanthes scabra]